MPEAAPPRLTPDQAVSISAPPEEKAADRVISPVEVDSRVAVSAGAEKDEGAKDIFSSTPDGRDENTIPTGLTGRVEKFIRYFQTGGRKRFELYLARSGKYAEMMRGILAKYGLPGDLIYLALIESGFSPKAYSVARAAGPWQFIAETGRRYGLRIDWWTDERRDYEKSTHAAASYLKDLHGIFESWPLATAAYNAGEGKIMKAVMKYNSEDYVELVRYRYLKQETKDYVPKMLAALTIGKDPEKYGFGDVKPEDPLRFDKVVVPGATDLAALGRIIGVPYDTLREWNPELKRFCTPPNQESYDLRLPKEYGRIAEERMEEIRTEAKVTFLHHQVRKGETLDSLSAKYQAPAASLKELNGLKGKGIGRSARLIIPVTGLSPDEAVPGKEVSPKQLEMAHMRAEEGRRKARSASSRTVKVRKGDTLERIARGSGVPVEDLARANGLKADSKLKAGGRLRLPAGASDGKKPAEAAQAGRKAAKHTILKDDTPGKPES